jgi:hypothetical protein
VLLLSACLFFQPIDLDSARKAGSFLGNVGYMFCALKGHNTPVVKLPEEANPVPGGMSTKVLISICGSGKCQHSQRFPMDAVLFSM